MIYEKKLFFRNYPFLLSEAKYKAKYGEGCKILTPKYMLQRWPMALAKVKLVIIHKVY